MSKTIRVVVIDDSAFMRKSLSMMLESDPHIKVVGTAANGRDGIEKIRQLQPDIVTLDIEMPVMDGLTALGIIMKEMPLPVLMVSSLTTEGAKATLDALNLGAVDFIPKELSFVSLNIVKIKDELIAKVKEIVQSRALQFRLNRIRSHTRGIGKQLAQPPMLPKVRRGAPLRTDLRAVVLGISTGGPFALLQVLPKLPANFPLGIVIVQHMPPHFTRTLADRLNGLSQIRVREASAGDRVQPGQALIAPGGYHLTFTPNGSFPQVRISPEPADTLFRPSADVMIASAVETFNAPLLGVIMTGMGKDGLEGMKALKKRGGFIVAQDEESCVVYGMPKAVVDEGLADLVVPLDEIPQTLIQITMGPQR